MQGTFTLESKPLGYRQLTVSDSAVALASATGGIPHGATRAVLNVEAEDMRWTDDGTVPTADVGMLAAAATTFELPSLQSINAFQAIRISADATLNVAFYGA